ncbi:putative nuclease HARBI1 [Saccostrea echinata]|uniref:putative nuclease HARBI1 n=1 Tax=Saccostrea echinata TaxID=191078 RepID=UPI002A83515A|nr:putative nuclease HARBI1 [Saccostrea echinata]
MLEPYLCRPTLRSYAMTAHEQVLMALRYYATGDKMTTIGDTMGFHVSSVSRSVRDVSAALCDIAPQYIKWPTDPAEKMTIKQGFYSIASFPGVIGAVDGTHTRIQSPREYEHTYVNRKGFHSINVQGICDHTGKFLNVSAKWPGSNHDSFIFRSSDIGIHLEGNHRGIDVDGVLLGDSGYACSRYLLTPYLRPSTRAQIKYNDAHAKTRGVVERCFGWWKRRFIVLHEENKCEPGRVAKIAVACAVLHNIALQRHEPMEDDINGPGDNGGNDGAVQGPINDNVRRFITEHYFN